MENTIIKRPIENLVTPLYFRGRGETMAIAKKRFALVEKKARLTRTTNAQIIRDAIDKYLQTV